MCFSVEASFTAATALVPVGAYCVWSAVRKERRFLPLALTPVVFAVQQASEGWVWYGLRHDNSRLVEGSTRVFLFFALAFWPFWVSFSLWFVERRRLTKMFLGISTVLSLSWLGLYAHAVLTPESEMNAHVVRHSIDYGLADLKGFREAPLIFWRLVYLSFICGPLLLVRTGSEVHWHLFSGVVAVLFVVSDLVYWYAFASVWCFFAAVSSLLLAFAFTRLPDPGGDSLHAVPAHL